MLDGDDNIFTDTLLRQGQQGGRQAAQQITKGIAEYLSSEDIQVFGRGLSFWVTVYFNKTGLLNALTGNDICTPEQFEAFCVGFSQASPRFLMIDVGYGKDAVEFKIRGMYLSSVVLPCALSDTKHIQNIFRRLLDFLKLFGCFSAVRYSVLS